MYIAYTHTPKHTHTHTPTHTHSMHSCKIEDHLTICKKRSRPCINHVYGCQEEVMDDQVNV